MRSAKRAADRVDAGDVGLGAFTGSAAAAGVLEDEAAVDGVSDVVSLNFGTKRIPTAATSVNPMVDHSADRMSDRTRVLPSWSMCKIVNSFDHSSLDILLQRAKRPNVIPIAIVRSPTTDTVTLLAYHEDDNHLYIATRATTTLIDVLHDMDRRPTKRQTLLLRGFARKWQSVQHQIHRIVRGLKRPLAGIVWTGHSLGGAISILFFTMASSAAAPDPTVTPDPTVAPTPARDNPDPAPDARDNPDPTPDAPPSFCITFGAPSPFAATARPPPSLRMVAAIYTPHDPLLDYAHHLTKYTWSAHTRDLLPLRRKKKATFPALRIIHLATKPSHHSHHRECAYDALFEPSSIEPNCT
jgi:hypothetical protein